MDISVVIPVYNGRELLKRYLPSVDAACRAYSRGRTEVVIVDDAGSDGTPDFLRAEYPAVRLLRHRANQGFPATANDGLLYASHGVVVLLNNDVQVAPDFLEHVPGHFSDASVFAVRPALADSASGDRLSSPRIGGHFRLGHFEVPADAGADRRYAFFAGGGASAYDRAKFLELGGFDELFSPFYFEDVDLSYRAWKRGWKVVYEPRCMAWHQGGATIKRFHAKRHISATAERNKFFLVWKNVTDAGLLARHFLLAPLRIVYWYLRGDRAPMKGLYMAMAELPQVMEKRRFERLLMQKEDDEIFSLFR